MEVYFNLSESEYKYNPLRVEMDRPVEGNS